MFSECYVFIFIFLLACILLYPDMPVDTFFMSHSIILKLITCAFPQLIHMHSPCRQISSNNQFRHCASMSICAYLCVLMHVQTYINSSEYIFCQEVQARAIRKKKMTTKYAQSFIFFKPTLQRILYVYAWYCHIIKSNQNLCSCGLTQFQLFPLFLGILLFFLAVGGGRWRDRITLTTFF